MARALALRSNFTGPDLRSPARGSKDTSQARRLLSLTVIHDSGTRSEAARLWSVSVWSSPCSEACETRRCC